MRLLPVFLLLAGALAPAVHTIPHEEYRARRLALRKKLPQAVVVVTGATEAEKGGLRSGFIQEPNFYYLTGWGEPGAVAVIAPGGDFLFLPKRNEVRERYTGPKAASGDAGVAALTGFDLVLSTDSFEEKLRELSAAAPKVYTLAKLPGADKVQQALAGREILDAAPAIAAQRMIKSGRELELIQRAVDVTIEGHRAAWRRLAAGLLEYQIAASLSFVFLERGCERHAYFPIVGSGPNAVILHYSANRRRIDAGELLLIDAGAECSAYVADLTRTIPVSGKFTARQREVYEVVLGAQKAAIAAARPGMRLVGHGEGTLNQVALDYVNARGKDRHGNPLGKYYLHQLGHHVGLEVHDAVDPEMALAPGMVVTIEPGLYIAEEGIGVRIEDVVLITENGAHVLSAALPREAREIERALARRD